MRIFVLLLSIMLWSVTPMLKAQENIYSDELFQLKTLNTSLNAQLSSAVDEINKLQIENYQLKLSDEIQKELEKTRKELANKSYEVKYLRQKLMISKDENFFKYK